MIACAVPAPADAQHNGHADDVAAALRSVTLRPDQARPTAAVVEQIRNAEQPPADAVHQLANDLADGVAAGQLDQKRLDADVNKLVGGVETTRLGMADALAELHQILDARQRAQWVAARREQVKRAAAAPHDPVGAREAELGEGLALTPEQAHQFHRKLVDATAEIHRAQREHASERAKHVKAILDAFESDSFDARALGVSDMVPGQVRMSARIEVTAVTVLLGVLNAPQRAQLADRLRSADRVD